MRIEFPESVDLTRLVRALRAEAERQGFHIVGNYTGEISLEFRSGRVADLVRDLEDSIVLDRLAASFPITSHRATPEGTPLSSGVA